MPEPHDPPSTLPPTDEPSRGEGEKAERRRPRVLGRPDANPRLAAAQYVARHRLEPFHEALAGLAVAVFGPDATAVPHLRREGTRRRLTFVIDAADPSASVDYAQFLPRERSFWTAYAHVPKPNVPFTVAIRPSRGWCRTEALAPFFAYLHPGDNAM